MQRGLTERAKKFRATCVKNITYDIDYYFKQVDERPETVSAAVARTAVDGNGRR